MNPGDFNWCFSELERRKMKLIKPEKAMYALFEAGCEFCEDQGLDVRENIRQTIYDMNTRFVKAFHQIYEELDLPFELDLVGIIDWRKYGP